MKIEIETGEKGHPGDVVIKIDGKDITAFTEVLFGYNTRKTGLHVLHMRADAFANAGEFSTGIFRPIVEEMKARAEEMRKTNDDITAAGKYKKAKGMLSG